MQPIDINIKKLPPLSIYIHFPWCIKKCPYCDFNSYSIKLSNIPETEYINALVLDLKNSLAVVKGRTINTIYIGGGSPSLLSNTALDYLLNKLSILACINANAEITLEANPSQFELKRFTEFRKSGINRLSLGIQSFNKKFLLALGRSHYNNNIEISKIIENVSDIFDNFNLDLIYALPGQNLKDCQSDIIKALSFNPKHLSVYQLTIEQNTHFYKFPPQNLPNHDLSSDMGNWIKNYLINAGFENYEISAYAYSNKYSLHNMNYWKFGDYIGVGAGAHSKITFPKNIIRQVRFKHPQHYIKAAKIGNTIANHYSIKPKDLPFEFMLNVLRLSSGVKSISFTERTGLPLTFIQSYLTKAIETGLLNSNLKYIKATPMGLNFLNDLQSIFLD